MSKNKTIAVLASCAVIFSALACYLIYTYMTPKRETIYTFNDDYSIGEQVTSSMLVPLQVDASVVAAGNSESADTWFVTSSTISSVLRSGDSLRMDVSEGMPLTSSMLSVSGGSTIEMNMKSDSIAVSVPVGQFSGITNDLKNGAKVNVYATMNGTTTLIQQNVRVLQVFKSDGAITGVALEESIYGSMELINSMEQGDIYLGLIDASGYQAAEGEAPSYPEKAASDLTSEDLEGGSDYESYLQEAENYSSQKASTEAADETESSTETESGQDNGAIFTP